MSQSKYHYVFGPVLSRRLGRSLGVDVVPFKACSYDCAYCQLGHTTQLSLERKDYVPLDAVVAELVQKLNSGIEADHISIAGSGEPTLYSRLGELIAAIKAITSIPIAVITNGSLLWDEQVQTELLEADLIVPNLDAGAEATFAEINRPPAGLTLQKMVDGLAGFRQRFTGQIWLEIFLLKGVNDSEAEIGHMVEHVRRIQPDRVQLNTLARPAPGSGLCPVSPETLAGIAGHFEPVAEIIAATSAAVSAGVTAEPQDVLDVLKRHPCTADDIAAGLQITLEQAAAHLEALIEQGTIVSESRAGTTFYIAV